MARSLSAENSSLQIVVVLITAPPGTAQSIAEALIEARLAACVNVLPGVHSVYRWQGEIERDEETLLLAKTTRTSVPRLESLVRELHPYENPEVLALPIEAGSLPYLDWINESVAE